MLPLRGTVIFPGLTAPIAAGRPGTLRAIEAALKGERLVFAVAQRDNTDEPTPDILYSMGVIARIGQIQRGLGGVQLLLQGEQRATVAPVHQTEGYLSAVVMPVEEMKPVNENDPAFVALHKEIRERAAELGERRGLPEEVVHQVLDAVTDPGRFADLVAGYIELPVAEKQGLLETLSVEERLRRVLVHVQRQIGMLEMQEEIKSQVQEELGERQREMYLREQMKAIQKELGDDDQIARRSASSAKSSTSSSCPKRRDRRSSASSDVSSGRDASRWRRRSSAPISSGSPSCRGTSVRTTTSTSCARRPCSTRTTTACRT